MFYRPLFLAGAAVAVSAQSATSPSPSATEPCALLAASQSSNPKLFFPANVAYDCLQSVPVDKEGDAQLIDEIKLYLKWNTDTTYFKNLPDWYDNPSFDLLGSLDDIKSGLQNQKFKSEYEVQSAVTTLFTKTGDNHISWTADISTILSFSRQVILASVSDGKSTPEIFSYQDLRSVYFGSQNFTPSAVKQINGQDATEYLKKLSKSSPYHDAHARYNALFPNQAFTSIGEQTYAGLFSGGDYDGPNTTLAFANGTTRTWNNLASTREDFSDVNSGDEFFSKFCQTQSSTPTPSSSSTPSAASSTMASATATPTAVGYPYPVLLHPGNAIGGYYLNGTSNHDVAVLSIPTFEPTESNSQTGSQPIIDFANVAREFIKKAVVDGKTKMLVDLRANGGGDTVLGYDLFKEFFPQIDPFRATRRHAHQAYDLLSQFVASEIDNVNETYAQTDAFITEARRLAEFYYGFDLTADLTDFASEKDFYGPHTFNNDNFTSLRSLNLSNVFSHTTTNFTVAGYGGALASTSQPFKAENILLLQDGFCSSTCAIFSELMKTNGGVETIAIGGLPDTTDMQTVGGTKGWLTWTLDSINQFVSIAYLYANKTVQDTWTGTDLVLLNTTSKIFERYKSFQVNAADGIRKNDKTQTPLQFTYEVAECRIWYTIPMLFNVTEVWSAAANTKWGNGTCAAGKGYGNGTSSTTPSATPTPSTTSGAESIKLSAMSLALIVTSALLMIV